ncbi:MAG TPA: undecaprenyldiphospho-muramoylpentapeptide beta-N-acetylglucosaminyltransferase [Armatimonadota bacterium]|nr:undecaprenyldiphospho-muramoylpentapeptide beta-N-acetylglucosaminyltransferase [Armatimonadota bacterium]
MKDESNSETQHQRPSTHDLTPNTQDLTPNTQDLRPFSGKRLLIAGGGTGGHLYPGLAVAEVWTRGGGVVGFVGAPGNIEERVVPGAGYPFYKVEVRGFARGRSWRDRIQVVRALFLLFTLAPLRQALHAIREFRPTVALGIGGYVSGPLLLAARLSRVPTMILQLDACPGLANRIAGLFVDRIGVAMGDVGVEFRRRDRVRLVGNPIRSEIVSASRAEALDAFALVPGRRTILVFGGSLGSRAINQAITGALRQLESVGRDIQVIHVTGRAHPIALAPEEADALGIIYRALEYCDRMPLALAAADLVVCRAGATTIAELTARGAPAILIPWSGAADNHQEGNARMLEVSRAARVLTDRDLTPESLADEIRALIDQPDRLEAMAAASREMGVPDAADRVALELAKLG